MALEPSVREKLNRAHPDNLSPYSGERPGKATIFWGVRNQTLYTDTTHKSVHNGVMADHPEIVREILPPDIYERMMAGEFKHPGWGTTNFGRSSPSSHSWVGWVARQGHNIVSLWPRSHSGVRYAGGESGATSFFQPQAEIPKMLRALMGQGNAVHFGVEPPRVDESWVVTMMDEMAPTLVGDLIEGSGPGGPPSGASDSRPPGC